MEYKGSFEIFDPTSIRTYPVRSRANRVHIENLSGVERLARKRFNVAAGVRHDIRILAGAIVSARRQAKPVILFTGAHLIKNGLGPLVVELVKKGLVNLVAGNAATAIHDFELALIGQTSETVPAGLAGGLFGMAREFEIINAALAVGNERRIGFGEALGRTICEESFRDDVLDRVGDVSTREFSHPEVSLLAACFEAGVPFTVHASVGTDVIDQHASFDGQSKGGCSGRDFLIYVQHVTKLTRGGVVVNIGSAVTGPEVLLKAVSMAANAGSPPHGVLTADFDLRDYYPDQMTDESSEGYYFRDQKSIVTRIPRAFGGQGLYIHGDQRQTFPLLCKEVLDRQASLEKTE